MKARQATYLLLALACFGLVACTDRAENSDPASVTPQPELSAPAEAEDNTANPAPAEDITPQSEEVEEAREVEEAEQSAAEEATPPQPVVAEEEEVVPAEVEAPATPAPATPPAHDPAAATRSDPVPEELYSDAEVVETVPDDIYFPNCAAAEAGGYSSMKEGEAGYRAELDDNGNGVACE